MKPVTLLFGLDGATFTILDDLVSRGLMPHLAEFMRTGVRSPLTSITPPLTPPAWTSLVTGRMPGDHGVLGFFQWDSPEARSMQLISSRQVAAETLWSMVNRQGHRAGVLNFVAHQPAPRIDGWVIPGWVTPRWLRSFSHPPSLIDRLKKALPEFDLNTLAIDLETESKAVAGAPIDNYHAWVNLHIRRERQWFNVLWYLMETDPVDLAAVVFDGVDKLQHGLWSYLDPQLASGCPSPEFQRIRSAAWEYYKLIDELLGETVRRAGPESTIVICSDHGFTASYEILAINTWLEQQGYLAWRSDYDGVEDAIDLNPTSYQYGAFDMSRTKAYAVISSSNGIHIPVRRTPDGEGLPPDQYESFRRELTESLLEKFVDPATGESLVKRVWPREEIFRGRFMDIAPDLTVTLRDHGFFSVRRARQVYTRRPNVIGTHHPEGVFLARGPGIRHGVRLDGAHITDIAPTVLSSMGVPIPSDLPGRPLTEIFQDGFSAPRRSSTDSVQPIIETGAAVEEAEIVNRLKVLGYIE